VDIDGATMNGVMAMLYAKGLQLARSWNRRESRLSEVAEAAVANELQRQ
jgi:hypothetical protein